MTELEKLLAGELYDYSDTEIAQLHGKAYYLSMKINNNLSFDNLEEMKAAIKREQSGACSDYAEHEQARPKVKCGRME